MSNPVAAQILATKEAPKAPEAPTEPIPPTGAATLNAPTEALTTNPKPTETPSQMSEKYEVYAKRERERIHREIEEKQRIANLTAKERDIEEREKKWQTLKNSPLEALKDLGFSYDDLTKAVLEDQKGLTPEMKLKRLEEENEKRWKALEEKEQRAEEDRKAQAEEQKTAAMKKYKSDVEEFISRNTETYELTKLFGQTDLVIATVEEHYRRTAEAGKPEIMSTEDAAKLVEKYMEDQLDSAMKTKRYQSKLTPPGALPAQGKPPTLDQQKKPNTLAAGIINASHSPDSPARSEQERWQRAMAALEGSLRTV